MTVSPARSGALSPNQQARHDQIVAATRELLATDGIEACTERRVATAAGLTKSAVHYYFADLDALVEEAMAAHVDAFIAGLQAAVESVPAGSVLTRLVDAYLDVFAQRPEVAMLWFEFWIHTTRAGRLSELAAIEDRMIELVRQAIERDGGTRRRRSARDVYTLLLGLIVDDSVRPGRSRRTVHTLVAAVLEPRPAVTASGSR